MVEDRRFPGAGLESSLAPSQEGTLDDQEPHAVAVLSESWLEHSYVEDVFSSMNLRIKLRISSLISAGTVAARREEEIN